MRELKVFKAKENKRLFIFLSYIELTEKWGYPVNENEIDNFPKYSAEVLSHINAKKLDLVLIDGRLRVACALKTIIECVDNFKLEILIHDF